MQPNKAKPQLTSIDINCDLGEGKSVQDCMKDASIMQYISRCNIACGGHAGNQLTMKHSLHSAKQFQLHCGAHPGYPDKDNFGRQSMAIHYDKLADSIRKQVDTLLFYADQQSTSLNHIKFHGALYNDAENDQFLANRLTELISQYYPSLKLLGLANGAMQKAADNHNIPFLKEGFMDRAYHSSGQLVSRSLSGSVYSNIDQIIKQATSLAQQKSIKSIEEMSIVIQVDSICLHGDSPKASTIAKQLSHHLIAQRIAIQ